MTNASSAKDHLIQADGLEPDTAVVEIQKAKVYATLALAVELGRIADSLDKLPSRIGDRS
jgi:hypothetical protein